MMGSKAPGKKKAVKKPPAIDLGRILRNFQLIRFGKEPLKVSNIIAVPSAIWNATNCRTPRVLVSPHKSTIII